MKSPAPKTHLETENRLLLIVIIYKIMGDIIDFRTREVIDSASPDGLYANQIDQVVLGELLECTDVSAAADTETVDRILRGIGPICFPRLTKPSAEY